MPETTINTSDVLALLDSLKTSQSETLESELVEFKLYESENSLHNCKNLPGEVCALTNHQGGVIVIGVMDSSDLNDRGFEEQLVGFERVDEILTASRIKGRVQGSINLEVHNIDFESKTYTAIFVARARERLVTTSSGKAYIRCGRDSRPMTPDEIETKVKSLRSYDWSAEPVFDASIDELNPNHVEDALKEFVERRGLGEVSREQFLESIGATSNGVLNRGGILFLGSVNAIHQHLSDFEFRVSWKRGAELRLNEVWSDNLWHSVQIAKQHIGGCISNLTIDHHGKSYDFPNLDPDAFHEAFVNAIVHRDYTVEGMISVEFIDGAFIVTSPGGFYGGVNADNIAWHEPRHRNRCLARMLMEFGLVDRAGMGVVRMGLQSLIYGRKFPVFEEISETVRVTLHAEYFRPGIFVLTNKREELYISDLVILNALYEKGYLDISEALHLIQKLAADEYEAVLHFIERWKLHVELCGSKDGIFIRVREEADVIFEIDRSFKVPKQSEKCVRLFTFLMKHGSSSNEDLANLLDYNHASSRSRFLNDIPWLEKSGTGSNTRWRLSSSLFQINQ